MGVYKDGFDEGLWVDTSGISTPSGKQSLLPLVMRVNYTVCIMVHWRLMPSLLHELNQAFLLAYTLNIMLLNSPIPGL